MKRLNIPLYLLIMLLIYACNEPPEVLDKDISVAEVKEVFASLGGNSNGRQDTIGIDWDNARYKEISVGDALVFPLENVSGTYVSSEDNPVLYPLKNQGYAFAYKDENETVKLEYVQATPTADTEAFTGVVTVSDWNANAKYAFFYENGMLVTPESNGRTDGTVCTEIYTFNCTAVYAGGELQSASCTFAGTTTECTTTKEPSGIAPDDYEEPRGGSRDNSNLCPHPFIEGGFVKCDDLIAVEVFKESLENILITTQDPDQARINLLIYLENFGGPEGKEFVKMFNELWNSEGLDYYDKLLLNEMAFKFKQQLVAQYFQEIFSPANVAIILLLGNHVNASAQIRSNYFRIVPRYMSSGALGQGFRTMSAFKNVYGAAGAGKAWHHIVSQRPSNLIKFGADKIHNTKNLVKLPHGAGTWHNRITSFYLTKNPINPLTGTRIMTNNLRFGEWLAQKSYVEQMEWGLRVMQWLK